MLFHLIDTYQVVDQFLKLMRKYFLMTFDIPITHSSEIRHVEVEAFDPIIVFTTHVNHYGKSPRKPYPLCSMVHVILTSPALATNTSQPLNINKHTYVTMGTRCNSTSFF